MPPADHGNWCPYKIRQPPTLINFIFVEGMHAKIYLYLKYIYNFKKLYIKIKE